MATITISPRIDQKDKNGYTAIRIIVQSKGFRVRHQVPTIRINPEFWDADQRRVTDKHNNHQGINRIIQKTLSDVERIVLDSEYKGGNFNRDLLKVQLKGYDDTSVYDFWEKTIKDRGSNISKGTKTIYKTSLMKLKRFQPTLLFSEVTLDFLERFECYLRDDHDNRDNTIHKNMKNLKSMVRRAVATMNIENKAFMLYKMPHEDTFRDVISLEDLDRMLELLYSERLLKNGGKSSQETLALFCLQALTGLRYSDASRFDITEFIKDDKIRIGTDKTGMAVYIPLHKRLLRLLDYKAYKFTPPTLQATNRLLIAIAILSEVPIKITTHTAVHSFCTICIELGIPIEVISKLRGHASIKTTQIYLQIKNKFIDTEMKKWDLSENSDPKEITKATAVFIQANDGHWFCIHEDNEDLFGKLLEHGEDDEWEMFNMKFGDNMIGGDPHVYRKTLK